MRVRLAGLLVAGALMVGGAGVWEGATFDAGEVVRLRAHFDSVDRELRSADVAGLSIAQREQRNRVITWLRDYRNAGLFPRNKHFRAASMPYFRDARGTLCAMAYLVARSGHVDVVDRIAATRNNAFIRELAGDRELQLWLQEMGLTLDEAARVQPAYEPQPRPVLSYAWSSWLVSGSALASSAFNVVAPGKKSAWAGLVTGAGALVLGAANWGADAGDGNVAKANVAIGLGTLALSVRGFTHRSDPLRRATAEPASQRGRTMGINPIVQPDRGRARVGLLYSATF